MLDQKDILKRFVDRHNDKYNYTLFNYAGMKTPATIICPEHGEFEQTPENHLKTFGCSECSYIIQGEKKALIACNSFKEKAVLKHGSLYDYNEVLYTKATTKIKIRCLIHGIFEQTPANHLQGQGCPECQKTFSYTTQSFILKANSIHQSKYDYDNVNYIGAKKKVTIICPEHGEFKQTPTIHLKGSGCPKCKSQKLREIKLGNLKNFISLANSIHNFKYSYVKTVYIDSFTKVTIICPEHGEFEQTPNNHGNQGTGCPSCSKSGFHSNKSATLYYIYDPQEDLYKIGITNGDLYSRFCKNFIQDRKIEILQEDYYDVGQDALIAEQEILEAFNYARCVNKSWPEDKGGKTEFFNEDILNLKNIKDFK